MPETTPTPNPRPTEATWQLPHTPRTAPRARALLRSQLTAWKIDAEVAETAELLLSELVTNSLRHASTPPGREIGVRIATYDGRLRVEVADANNCRPTPRQAGPDDEGGRGLTLVQALADRWGCCPRPHGIGKATWAELPLVPRSAQRAAVPPEASLGTPDVTRQPSPSAV
ncbi:ATP-binding protein [Streptomyces geranii]|uniref:ATP-binding protein n=1 Tax=Streptomyces geranii TaxID=2058923 RepID=UPI000D0274E7|nr:ATP-binding protein [Streptomyces geranii]